MTLSEALRRSRHSLVFAFLFSVFVNVLMLTGPLFMLQVYDRVLGSRSEETLVALLALVIGLYGLMWLLDFARTRLLARYGARFQSALDDRVFQAQIGQAQRTPEAQSASRDLEAVQGFYASPALPAFIKGINLRAAVVELHPAVLSDAEIALIYDTMIADNLCPRVEHSSENVVAFERIDPSVAQFPILEWPNESLRALHPEPHPLAMEARRTAKP